MLRVANDSFAGVTPGLLQPALVAEFQAQTSARSDEEFVSELASLARIPSPVTRDFLVDMLVDLASSGRTARARVALPVVAEALTDEESYKRGCLRLLVNLQFALAVLLMKEVQRTQPPAPAIGQWLSVAMRYHYRYRCESRALAPEQALEAVRDATAAINDRPEGLSLATIVEPRLLADCKATECSFQSEAIKVTPPLVADQDGVPRVAEHLTVAQQTLGFARVANATVIGCRSTIFFGADLVADDPLSNMAVGEFSPFGMEDAYAGVVFHLSGDNGRKVVVVRRPQPGERIERGVFLNGHYQYNYFHWLAEYLTQLPYILDQSAYADWPLLIGEEALAHANHVRLLQRLAGAVQRQVIALRKNVAYSVGELLLPPKLARVTLCHTRIDSRPEDYAFAPGAIRRLHDGLAAPGGTPRRRIFLARKRDDRLLNQPAIRAEFEQAGFESVHPEDLDFERARLLFAETAYLAGPTGAAFTNLLLCPPGATAIIFTTDLGRRAGFFSGLAGPLGQTVIYVDGPGQTAGLTLSPFEIDPRRVRRLLQLLLPQ